MTILGFDTSTKFLPVVLGDESGIIYACDLDSYLKHSAILIPSVKRVLKEGGRKREDIDVVAVGLGPGSLTGLRVGLATAKGLCLGLNKPLIGICSLDIIAQNTEKDETDICVLVDAKRSLVFSALYRRSRGRVKRIRPLRLSSPEEAISGLKGDTVFSGDGMFLYKGLIRKMTNDPCFACEKDWYPRSECILKTALLSRNKKTRDINEIVPLYLYPKECQIRVVSCEL